MNPRRSILALLLLAALCGCEDKHRYVVKAPPPDADRVAVIRAGGSGGGSGAGSADSQVEPTGWATIRGTIRLSGPPPPNAPYNINADVSVCAPGGEMPLQEIYVVGDNYGLADVAVYLKTDLSNNDEEKWIHESARPGWSDEVLFDQHACLFDTHLLALQTSQPLKIKNSDTVSHNTKLESNTSSGNYTLNPGQSVVANLSGEESRPFKVSCAMHTWMYAWIMPRDNGYFCVTDETGNFEIPNLPAGVPLSIYFWHESADINASTVEGGGNFRRSQLSITLEPDSVHNWDIVVPAP